MCSDYTPNRPLVVKSAALHPLVQNVSTDYFKRTFSVLLIWMTLPSWITIWTSPWRMDWIASMICWIGTLLSTALPELPVGMLNQSYDAIPALFEVTKLVGPISKCQDGLIQSFIRDVCTTKACIKDVWCQRLSLTKLCDLL